MRFTTSLPARSSPRAQSGLHAASPRADFRPACAREAADSGPIAQAIGAVVLLLIWLLVLFLALWPAWSAVWARLAAAVSPLKH